MSPNNDVHEFIEKLFLKTLGISREDHLIMGGDWNTVLKNNLDKLVGAAQHANIYYQNYINGITNDYGLCDIYRLTRGKERMYTHFNKQYKTASRLDFFLIDDNLVNLPVCKTDISHGYNSDHRYVLLSIQGSSILKEVEDTENLTTRTYRMRSLLWRYGKTKKKRNKKKKEQLMKYIAKVKNTANFMVDDRRLRNEFFEAEYKLNSILDLEKQGLITKSRAQWTEQG